MRHLLRSRPWATPGGGTGSKREGYIKGLKQLIDLRTPLSPSSLPVWRILWEGKQSGLIGTEGAGCGHVTSILSTQSAGQPAPPWRARGRKKREREECTFIVYNTENAQRFPAACRTLFWKLAITNPKTQSWSSPPPPPLPSISLPHLCQGGNHDSSCGVKVNVLD